MSQAKPESMDEPPAEAAAEPDAALALPAPVERRRSKTMSRKEMARDLRRRRLTGEVDPEEQELLRSVEDNRPRAPASSSPASTTSTWT